MPACCCKIFWRCPVSLTKFSCWFKFHVNIINSSRVMRIFVYKELTRNLEIRNSTIWVLPNIWRLGQVRDTKFGTNLSNKKLLKSAKYQGYSFYHFWVIKNKAEEVNLPPPRLGLKQFFLSHSNDMISYRVQFIDLWFVFHNSSWSFHEPYFSRKHIFHKSYRVNRTQDYGLKTCKQVQNYLAMS